MPIEGQSRTWTVVVGESGDSTTAVWEPAAESSGKVFICAHGAGGHMADRSIVAVTSALRARGVDTVRFNFLYTERKLRRPDPMPRLLACLQAVVARVRTEVTPRTLIVGGRSMGGRAASVFVSQGGACDGLLLLAYPLHPPGDPAKLRVDHLPAIRVPVLAISGTRDPFCTPELMTRTLSQLGPNWRLHWLEGGDHSFHVLKRSGRTNELALAEAADHAAQWIGTTAPVRRA